MNTKYRDYFAIDSDFFPAVDEKLIDQGKVDWKKFFPHATFISLLKNVVRVLERIDKLSLWVEGSYGTGKSHAVLTLKKILDAPVEELDSYFKRYGLANDLFNKIRGLKEAEGEILTVHRYGSSAIYGDRDLVLAVQESVKKALREKGIENRGEAALKDSVLSWLQDETNHTYFNSLITKKHSALFAGDDADAVVSKLQSYTDAALISLMNKIFKVADEAGISALKLDVDGLVAWLNSIISGNKLKAIVFIWDEFTEYFSHCRNSLTGFQRLAQMSATEPFYLCIVTHKSKALFGDTDRDSKILDRFVQPTCKLELPENIAFQLMGQALEKNPDPNVSKDWENYAEDLNGRLQNSRKWVINCARIEEKDLRGILPIHPYAALVLKHIASGYASDQRSMFDFIKNNRGEEIKGFQWFIDNYGPLDENPLLTIDMLWDFFYEKGKNNLPLDVRSILDTCSQYEKKLALDELKVLRTVLLLQAISQRVGDAVELFIPNETNLNNAYDGTSLENNEAVRIAKKLVQDGILYDKRIGNNHSQFAAMTGKNGIIDSLAFEKAKKQYLEEKTSTLILKGNLAGAIALPPALAMRYLIKCVSAESLVSTINQMRNQEASYGNKIMVVAAFSRNDAESASVRKLIKEKIADLTYNIHFIDVGATPLGNSDLERYAENAAYESCYRPKDGKLADEYAQKATTILDEWRDKIVNGEFTVFSSEYPQGERTANIAALIDLLRQINVKRYPLSLENFMNVTETMYSANSLKQGVKCGAEEEVSGAYRSGNPATKLENALEGAWKTPRYWKEGGASKTTGKLKIEMEELIRKGFEASGRISIKAIYDNFSKAPFGFMPCNLTAFVLGFLLKEYAVDAYQWSDGQTSTGMTIAKLQEMIDEIIKQQNTPGARYKDKYIVAMTEEEKIFNDCSSKVFGIPRDQCVSIEQTRNRIRLKMKDLDFPVWCVKNIIAEQRLATAADVLEKLVDCFTSVANSGSIPGGRTETDAALEIGKICKEHKTAINDLSVLLTKENCKEGMLAFLNEFQGGILPQLASKVKDNGNFINVIKKKFDADSANWVWAKETAELKISEVITEYKILSESQKAGISAVSINDAIQEWCNKARFIKLPYDLVENHADDAKIFLTNLVQIKRAGMLLDSQKKEFLAALETNLSAFLHFYSEQEKYFRELCKFYLDGFSDEECSDIYNTIPFDVFTKGKSEFLNLVHAKVDEFKKSQGKTKLRSFWKEKTGSATPQEWSKINKMPILCLVPEDELQEAQKTFITLQRNNPDQHDIDAAMAYLGKAAFFEALQNCDACERAFREKIIKSFATMLNDVREVQKYLCDKLTLEPYHWFGSPEVERKLKEFAQDRYDREGSDRALSIIDHMDDNKLKTYLKRLVKDNMIVGMEIIKDK